MDGNGGSGSTQIAQTALVWLENLTVHGEREEAKRRSKPRSLVPSARCEGNI